MTSREQVLLRALKYLVRHYVGQLENARERIIFLGGECDSVEMMERGDPHLKQVREVIASVEAAPVETPVATDHAENLAKALECYLSAHDILSGVQSADDATGQNDASEGGFHDKANDAWRAMRAALHEYRKRRAMKTSAAPAADVPCLWCGCPRSEHRLAEPSDGMFDPRTRAVCPREVKE